MRPNWRSDDLPVVLRIAVCGLTGAGKTSLINSIITALTGGVVLWWNVNSGHSSSMGPRIPGQLGPEEHFIGIATKNGKAQMFIELVDNRGLLNEADIDETMRIVTGHIPTNTIVKRVGDKDYVEKFTSAFPQKAERFHLALLVIPADLPEDKISMYSQLRLAIRETNIPVLHVFTKSDVPCADEKIHKIKDSLGLTEHNYLRTTNYDETKPDNDADEEINSQALFVLMWAILIAELKGIPITHQKSFAIKQQEVAMGIKQAKTVVSNCANQAKFAVVSSARDRMVHGFICGIIVALFLLLTKMF